MEVARLPLEGGRAYLVQAKGLVGPEAGVFMNMRLEAWGFFGEVAEAGPAEKETDMRAGQK